MSEPINTPSAVNFPSAFLITEDRLQAYLDASDVEARAELAVGLPPVFMALAGATQKARAEQVEKWRAKQAATLETSVSAVAAFLAKSDLADSFRSGQLALCALDQAVSDDLEALELARISREQEGHRKLNGVLRQLTGKHDSPHLGRDLAPTGIFVDEDGAVHWLDGGAFQDFSEFAGRVGLFLNIPASEVRIVS